MAKYNYDKTALKGLGVGAFLGEVKVREQKIAEADSTPSQSIFNSNVLAEKLHPQVQFAKVAKVVDHGSAKQYIFEPDASKGTESFAYFRAGQFVSILFKEKGLNTIRPYTLCCNPKDALAKKSTYSILVKGVKDGAVTSHILENWKPGTEVMMSPPIGNYYYTSLRDAKHVVALAGGSGITPFYSMASAIDTGIEDFKLTIIYGSRVSNDILLKDELEALAKRNAGKIKIVHVLSDEKKKGYEHGFITAEIIKKYGGNDDYSVFVCGPPAMYQFLGEEVNKLNLGPRRYRMEVPGETLDVSKLPGFKKSKKQVNHKVTLHIRGEVKTVEIPEDLTLVRGLEAAGIIIPTDCRSGKCGWCRSRLISGDVYFATDNRRAADIKFNWIHPCCTYAKSDIEMEVYPLF